MANFSTFKYKRRCPIFQKDLQKEDDDNLIVQSPVANKSTKNSKINCDKNRINSAPFKHNSMDSASNLKTVDKTEESCKNGTIFDKEALENDMCTSFRLDILKGIFKDAYSEDDVLNAVGNTNSLEQAVSILLESPIKGNGGGKKDDMVKTGQTDSKASSSKHSKGYKRLFSDDDDNDDDDVLFLETPSKQRKLSDPQDSSLVDCKKFIDLEDQDMKKLKELFPTCKHEELQSVLETNECLDDAIATMMAFSSPQKTNSNEKEKQDHDVFIIDDDRNGPDGDDDNDGDYHHDVEEIIVKDDAASTDTTLKKPKVVSVDDQYWESESGDDIHLSAEEKTQVLSMLEYSDVSEMALVPTCSIKKAEKICSLRPFHTWKIVVEKFQATKGLSDELLFNFCYFINERDKIGTLLDRCEIIAKDIRDLFVADKSHTQDEPAEPNKMSLVTKEQYLTKEPSNVAPGFKLKSYQLTGLNWLIALHKQGVNGILADEMGLGKTIQTIVFLAYLIEQGERGPHLIVVPASTADNWKRELDNWCPSVSYVHYSGSQEERNDIRDEILYDAKHFDILLTTYNMAISSIVDRAFLKKLHFHYGVYDEGHMLKNMKSQRYQSLLRLRPQRMLLLTGTPIQNNLMELMSLLLFIMPDMFQERSEGIKMIFGDNKLKKKEESVYEKQKVLQAKKIMEPFLLRRIKQDVLGQLPEKHEHFVECGLPSRQRKIYDDTFASCYKLLKSGEKVSGAGGIALFMQLRKAANHATLLRDFYTDGKLSEMAKLYCKDPSHHDSNPNLVLEDMQVMSDFELSRLCLEEKSLKRYELPNELIMECGKYLHLDSVLPDMKKKGDRVLLFNQFTMMMDITEVYLQTRKYKYLRLDGSTPVAERQDLIDRFNTEQDIFIFLLSTKAGGLGINLTSANVVILYDSDYNPHNDKQAEARCHRMGQTREVNVHRLVCKETIEETILKCAADKIRLHEHMSEKQKSSESEMEDVQTLLQAVFGLH